VGAELERSSAMTRLAEVDLAAEPGLYRITTSSSTVGYLEAVEGGGMRVMRCRGNGATMTGAHDDQWVYLTALKSGPRVQRDGVDFDLSEVDREDIKHGWLRVGSRHRYEYHVPGGYFDTTDFSWLQRACLEIERLDAMPPEGERTIPEREPRPDSGVEGAPDANG
jgi:hypothetical protein